jgi:hypothetical protein
MKTKISLIVMLWGFLFNPIFSQSVAPQIITNDCSGISHDLYGKLNDGKIIVIGWTMPCLTCAAPLLSVHNAVLNFMVSHPGKVEYWVADDFANTPCSSIISWCQNNGITNATYFSSSQINMNDFGSYGMPKVVVVGCFNGSIHYNVDNNPTGQGVTDAINFILNETGDCTSMNIEVVERNTFNVEVYPNPGTGEFNLKIPRGLGILKSALLTVTNSVGQIVYSEVLNFRELNGSIASVNLTHLSSGSYIFRIETEKGNYFSRISIQK